jgi:hypothetical protein
MDKDKKQDIEDQLSALFDDIHAAKMNILYAERDLQTLKDMLKDL